MLSTGNNCVTKDNFPHNVEVNNKGILVKLVFYYYYSNVIFTVRTFVCYDMCVNTCLVSDCRILVERILNTVLVPYSLEPADRMKRLYTLYACVDDHSVK